MNYQYTFTCKECGYLFTPKTYPSSSASRTMKCHKREKHPDLKKIGFRLKENDV